MSIYIAARLRVKRTHSEKKNLQDISPFLAAFEKFLHFMFFWADWVQKRVGFMRPTPYCGTIAAVENLVLYQWKICNA
jgi:hypothetical protein